MKDPMLGLRPLRFERTFRTTTTTTTRESATRDDDDDDADAQQLER